MLRPASFWGKKHVLVVCGEDGLDEVTLTGKTYVLELLDGKIKKYTISPEDFGVKRANFEEISGGDVKMNVRIAKEILSGKCKSRHLDLVLVNAALSLKLAGNAKTLKDGYKMAKGVLAQETFESFKLLSDLHPAYLNILSEEKKSLDNRKVLIKDLVKGNKKINFSKKSIIAEIKRKSPSAGVLTCENFSLKKSSFCLY